MPVLTDGAHQWFSGDASSAEMLETSLGDIKPSEVEFKVFSLAMYIPQQKILEATSLSHNLPYFSTYCPKFIPYLTRSD